MLADCFCLLLALVLPSFFPRALPRGRKKGRGAGNHESNLEPKRDDHAHTVRAFDSRRNDYAIISRRVPFLLKRKTSSPSPSSPWRLSLCNVSGGKPLRSRSSREQTALPFSPSVSHPIDVASFRHDSC